ncbi:AbrB family transcriptional regulator [Pseudoroseomonas globiformis]|uniref:AbrB family transcriptional regulator n=1 Tax=Teichococcus globiformis TaxID=2307229 RepID=A0ABV7FWR1_9PROT
MWKRLAQGRWPTLSHIPPIALWGILLVLTAAVVLVLDHVGLPAPVLLGAMAAAILLAVADARGRIPPGLFAAAQGVVGVMIAQSLRMDVATELLSDWPIFLAGVISVMVASSLLGWWLARRQVLPGTTAIWGSSPGAASAMMLMAEAQGADIRLVAVMLYLRVVMVAAIASLVASYVADGAGVAASIAPPWYDVWFPATAWSDLFLTIAAALGLSTMAVRLGIPAGPVLAPMVVAAVLQEMGWLRIELPPVLLAASYAVIGWSIGLRFTRPILAHAARALPSLVASTLMLIAICGAIAMLLHFTVGIDLLTAYLATSPGGVDSVAIIAASSEVDLAFIMAMQMARFLLVLVAGPAIARFFARKLRLADAGR